jgi:hypothetical protein
LNHFQEPKGNFGSSHVLGFFKWILVGAHGKSLLVHPNLFLSVLIHSKNKGYLSHSGANPLFPLEILKE